MSLRIVSNAKIKIPSRDVSHLHKKEYSDLEVRERINGNGIQTGTISFKVDGKVIRLFLEETDLPIGEYDLPCDGKIYVQNNRIVDFIPFPSQPTTM
jgi:hypothetical protein